MHSEEALRWLREESLRPLPSGFYRLTEALLSRFPESWQVVLLYGSTLRTLQLEGQVVDLYLLVSSYREAYPGRPLAGRLLPPNVFYLESGGLRAKYAVVTLEQFRREIERGWHPYFWGRFCQPVRITAYRSQEALSQTLEALLEAVLRMVRETVPLLEGPFDGETLWTVGLKCSYESELRAERSDLRARELYRFGREHFEQLTPLALSQLPYPVRQEGGRYLVEVPGWARLWCRLNWGLRRPVGKLLSLLRLIKAFFTYQGGVDYLLWKLERHSGKRIEVPEHVRRHPFLYGWPYLLKLYREGVFR